MKVRFRTNIDCCKLFMSDLDYDGEIAPNIGDGVIVHEEGSPKFKQVELKVCGRNFYRSTRDCRMEVEIELNLNNIWSERGLNDFEKWVKS